MGANPYLSSDIITPKQWLPKRKIIVNKILKFYSQNYLSAVSLQHLPLYFSQRMVFLARTVPVGSVDSYISGLQCDLVCSVVVG